jgi:hypothetical protein
VLEVTQVDPFGEIQARNRSTQAGYGGLHFAELCRQIFMARTELDSIFIQPPRKRWEGVVIYIKLAASKDLARLLLQPVYWLGNFTR